MMSPLTALLADLSVSLALSTVLVAVLARPLRLILRQLCPTGDVSVFWLVFTGVMLYLTPLMFAVLSLLTATVLEPVPVISAALVAALFGAVAALLVVGYQVANARPRANPAREGAFG